MVDKIPPYLITSMVISSLLFLGGVWLVIHLALKSWRISLPILFGLLIWYALILVLGNLGVFGWNPLFIPNIIFAFIITYFLGRRLYNSKFLQTVFDQVPLHWIFGVQIFRVMGYGFITFWSLGLLPGEFALPTGYGDVIVGLLAPVVAFIYYKRTTYAKKLALLWNYLGIADLVLSITLGIVTYPRPFQMLPTEIPNELIALFPLVKVPLFAVPLSLLLHLFSLRVLRKTTI